MEWISVDDALPENHGQRVICAYSFGTGESRYNSVDDLFYRCSDNGIFEIAFPFTTHWMPLPGPPEKNNGK